MAKRLDLLVLREEIVLKHLRAAVAEARAERDTEWTAELGFEAEDSDAAAPNQTPQKIAAQVKANNDSWEARAEQRGREQALEWAAKMAASHPWGQVALSEVIRRGPDSEKGGEDA